MSSNGIEEREPASPFTTSAPSLTKLRHRRFFKNRQLRNERLNRRDDVAGEGESASGDEGGSSGDESSTGTNVPSARPSEAQTSSRSTIAPASTTSPLSFTTPALQVPPSTSQPTTSSKVQASGTLVLTTATGFRKPTSTLSSAKQSITSIPALPDLLSTSSVTSRVRTQSSFSPLKATFVTTSTIRATETEASKAGNKLEQGQVKPVRNNHLPPGEIAAIVFGIMGAILFFLFLIIWAVRRRKQAKPSVTGEKSPPSVFGGLSMRFSFSNLIGRRRDREGATDAESRLWGAATTYGTPTEIDAPAYHPAYMQPSARGNNTEVPYVTRIETTSRRGDGGPAFPAPPAPTARMQDGVLRMPSRWFSRESTVTIPRFRDIRSWVGDQTNRIGGSGASTSSGTRMSADTMTGIPKIPGRYAQI